MNADRLLAHYDRIADAPDAIPRLRRFILDLAVRGKLVPQDASDEPASELLRRIEAETTRRLKDGEFREPQRYIRVEREGLPFRVPVHWRWTRLIEIARVSYGFAFASDRFNSVGKGMPLIRIRDISNTETQAHFDGDYDPQYVVQRGDYLVGMDGDFNLRRWRGRDGLLNQRVLRLSNWRCGVNPEYVSLPLQQVLDHLHSSTSQTTVKHLSAKQMNGIEIPLPPLAEQQRIVSRVDELMGLCDRLEVARAERETTRDRLTRSSLARLREPNPDTFQDDARFALGTLPALTARPDQIAHLRQAILDLAVRGKLVPQDPNDEPASDLLDAIALDVSARAKKSTKNREKNIETIDEDDAPFSPPSGWVWVKFGDIVISRDGERIPVSKDERSRLAKTYDYYGASGVIDKIDGFLFDRPLLLIGEDGANLVNRSTPIAFIARGQYWVNNHAHVLDGVSEGLLQYLELFINAIDLRPYITGTAQPKMNQAKMNRIPVALPPLAEQQRIVARVDKLMALCDRLVASLTDITATRHRLLDALMAETLEPMTSART